MTQPHVAWITNERHWIFVSRKRPIINLLQKCTDLECTDRSTLVHFVSHILNTVDLTFASAFEWLKSLVHYQAVGKVSTTDQAYSHTDHYSTESVRKENETIRLRHQFGWSQQRAIVLPFDQWQFSTKQILNNLTRRLFPEKMFLTQTNLGG